MKKFAFEPRNRLESSDIMTEETPTRPYNIRKRTKSISCSTGLKVKKVEVGTFKCSIPSTNEGRTTPPPVSYSMNLTSFMTQASPRSKQSKIPHVYYIVLC